MLTAVPQVVLYLPGPLPPPVGGHLDMIIESGQGVGLPVAVAVV